MNTDTVKLRKVRFLGSNVTIGEYNLVVDKILTLAKGKISSYVCVMNVHMLMEAHYDKEFSKSVDGADITTPDGMPLVFGINKFYKVGQQRVAGMDLITSLLSGAESKNIGVFIYGSTNDILANAQQRSYQQYPNLKLCGVYSPPFRPLTLEEESEVVTRINSSGAGLVLVALGCPKQEKWMASMKGKIDATLVGIGGALPVFAGLQSRAPEIMQRMGFEWLFRLYQEPTRLWKRYLLTNSKFIVLFLTHFLQRKRA